MQVFVRDNNVDQALKALKKKMQREGLFREMKLRGHYEKPSERRVREKAEAIRRARKLARKKLQREGLLPMKPRVGPGTVGRGGPARARAGIALHAPAIKLLAQDSAGLSSTAEIHGKQDQGAAAGGKDAGERGSRDPAARSFRRGR